MDLLEYRDSENEQRHPWETARFEVMQSLLKKHILQTPKTIADIGCGDTFVVNSLAHKFPSSQFFAVDTAFTNEDIKQFKSNSKTDNIQIIRDLNGINSQSQSLDLILLMDVIEHIEHDHQFLKELVNHDFVQNESLFFITVPAYQSLYSAHDKHLLHYRRYNRNKLVKTLKDSGLEILDSGYFFSSLVGVRIIQKMQESILGAKDQKGLAEKNYSRKKAELLKSFLLLDFRISRVFHKLHINIPGLSSYAICRKSVS